MKFLVCLLLLIGCGSDETKTVYGDPPGEEKPDGDSGNQEQKYAAVQPTIKSSCLTSGCHADGAIVDLRTAAKFAASNSKARVANGSMPPQQSGPGKAFTSAKKAAILSFFN